METQMEIFFIQNTTEKKGFIHYIGNRYTT